MRMLVLLTDFGTRDPYASLMRAAARKVNPDAVVEDLTHGIERFCITCGAYVLYTSYKWYPEDAIFVAVVDPGVGSGRRGLIVKVGKRYFVGPDNGILWPVIEENASISEAYVLEEEKAALWEVSPTFHGRDLFAPAAARISLGEDPLTISRRTDASSLRQLKLEYSRIIEGGACYRVIYIDVFGDVVLSSKGSEAKALMEMGKLRLLLEGKEIGYAVPAASFSLVPRSAIALYKNSSGFLEISANMGDLSSTYGIKVGDEVCLKQ